MDNLQIGKEDKIGKEETATLLCAAQEKMETESPLCAALNRKRPAAEGREDADPRKAAKTSMDSDN